MTAPRSIGPARSCTSTWASASPDLLCSMLTTFINTLMSAEADPVCGAGCGETSPERVDTRNGYRHREFDNLRRHTRGRDPQAALRQQLLPGQ
jgi:putative transposase